MGFLPSCSDDEQEAMPDDGTTKVFSNKLAVGDAANLTLTYSNEQLIGKDIEFSTADNKTATFELHYVLPGDAATRLEGVQLTPSDGGYSFKGQGRASNVNTTFSYNGLLTSDGRLQFNVTDVHVPDNILAQQGKFVVPDSTTMMWALEDGTVKYGGETYINIHFTMTSTSRPNLMSLALPIGASFLDNVLDYTLSDVTFGQDGNITASYGALPDTANITDMMAPIRRPNVDHFQASPKNMATYYFTDDTTMYVVPNVDMITKTIEENRTKSRAAIANGDSLLTHISAITGVLRQWATTGIRLTVKTQPRIIVGGEAYKNGYYVVYLQKKDIKEFIRIVEIARLLIPEETLKTNDLDLLKQQGVEIPPMLEQMLPLLQGFIPDMTIGGILDQIKMNLEDMDVLDFGLYLKK